MKPFTQEQFPLLSDASFLPCCPKCGGDFEAPVVRCVGEGFQCVHQCKECSASFALVPVTRLGVYELPSKNWQTQSTTPAIRVYPKDESLETLKAALAQQVPDMMNGFIIKTNSGNINIDSEFAEAFRNLAADVLQYRLNRTIANQTTRVEFIPRVEATR